MPGLTRMARLIGFGLILLCADIGHAQRFVGYGEAITPMSWSDFHKWLEPLGLSDGQLRFIIRAYDEYLEHAIAIEAEFMAERLQHIDKVTQRHEAGTQFSARDRVNEKRARHRFWDSLLRRMHERDNELFITCTAALVDAQIELLEPIRHARRRSMYRAAVGMLCGMSGLPYVELSELHVIEDAPASFRDILKDYERRLAQHAERIFHELSARDVQIDEELLAEFGDDPDWNSPEVSLRQMELMYGQGARNALRLADAVDELNRTTLQLIGQVLDDVEALKFELVVATDILLLDRAIVKHQFDPLFQAYEAEHEPEIHAVLRDTLLQIRTHILKVLREAFETRTPRALAPVPMDPGERMARMQVNNRARQEFRESIRAIEDQSRIALGKIADANAVAGLEAQLRWNREEQQQMFEERRRQATAPPSPQRVQIDRSSIQALVDWAEMEWSDHHEAAHRRYSERVEALENMVAEGGWADQTIGRILDVDAQLFRDLLEGSAHADDSVHAMLRNLRERTYSLAQIRYDNQPLGADILSMMIECDIRWGNDTELLDYVQAYDATRSHLVTAFIADFRSGSFRWHSAELAAIAKQNAEFLSSIRPLMQWEDYDCLWERYWRRAQPRIMVDEHAAGERFRKLLADRDALPEDLRIEVGARSLEYQETYRGLTEQMLALLNDSFFWSRGAVSTFEGSINGYVPEMGDPGRSMVIVAPQLGRLYRIRQNYSLLEHAYLDTIRMN